MSEVELSKFYSSWHYSAIRLLATLGPIDSHELRKKLKLSPNKTNESIEFLVKTGICVLNAGGKVQASSSITHIGADSPLVWRHHQNWRIKAMDRHFDPEDTELIYSGPLTISESDMAIVREKIVQLIQGLKKTVEGTNPELVACLNIDWVKV